MRKTSVIIECIILALGSLLSIQGTLKAYRLSSEYAPLFLFALLGIIFIAVLLIFIKRRFTYILGVGFIIFYVIFAGFGYIVCNVNAARIRRVRYYEGKTVELQIDGKSYAWTGEAFYKFKDLEPMDVSEREAYFVVDGEKTQINFVYVMPGEDDTIYYEFYGGSTGDYLIMTEP